MKKYLLFILFIALFIIPFNVWGGGSKSDDPWKSFKQSADQSWQQHMLQTDAQWNQLEREQKEQWLKFKEEVERIWDTFLDSTKKTWVDYGKDLDARSEVNFEKGTVKITAIVPKKTIDIKEAGVKKIANQVKKIFTRDNPAKLEVLKGQVKDQRGEIVTPKNLDQYIKNEIAPKIQIEKEPYKSKDGVERIKVKAEIHLVPDHIRIRAEKYLKSVNKQARRFDIKSQLIFAIIHTESYFNPLAKSPCGALGLMQLIPRHGAREAYQFVYREDKILSPEYLYNSNNNIEMGTAYVHLLKNQHFGHIKDTLKNQYIIICAYNWGPTALNQKIIISNDIYRMSANQLYALLGERTPEETRDYLRKVTERMKIYDNFYPN